MYVVRNFVISINICIPNFKDMTLGLLDKFSTPGTTKQDDTAPSLIKKISRQYFNGLRLNNDNYVEFLDLATNPSVVDGRNTIFDRGKSFSPHILTALSSNRRCGQDTLY